MSISLTNVRHSSRLWLLFCFVFKTLKKMEKSLLPEACQRYKVGKSIENVKGCHLDNNGRNVGYFKPLGHRSLSG